MDSNKLPLRLLSGSMSDEQHLQRLGFWLRIARERSGKSQEGAARELGLSAASKSTISDWENGVREPKLSQLRALARYYQAPINLFVDPPATAFEELDELVRAAAELEQEDWEAEAGERGREADDGPGASPRRRSA